MSIRKIPLKRRAYLDEDNSLTTVDDDHRPEDAQVSEYLSRIRETLLADRGIHDQAAKAFVSFVRAYSKHEASYIFRIKDLDLIGAAKSFGLLRMPRMPELKDIDRQDWNDAQVDWDTYAYLDKAQEAKRVAASAAEKSQREEEKESRRAARVDKKKANAAWSVQAQRKDERELRKEKRTRKKKWLKAQADTTVGSEPSLETSLKRGRDDGEDIGSDDNGDDWDELAREERMAKKVKKGDVKQKAFDAEFGIDLL
ncbi:hypothetical protein C0991_001233 [Blastosporella zonata]|nr:hypothetical protein C0991_001233 [Blastosporella zonata]